MRRSVQRDRARPVWWFNLGVACRGDGRLAEAAEAFRTALRFQPYHVPALFLLGRSLQDMGIVDGACAAFAQVLRLEADHAEARALFDAMSAVTAAMRREA